MASYDDDDPPEAQNPASAAPPVPPTLNTPPPPLPPAFTGVQRPTATMNADASQSARPTPGPSTPASPPIGATVNGVPTFNDATVPKGFVDVTNSTLSSPVAASSIPRPTPSGTFNGRTYSGAELDNLARSVNTIPSENFTKPAIGTLGTPVSQDQGVQIAAMNIARPVASLDPSGARPVASGSYDPTAAGRDYQSDLASIFNKDPRSVLGTAAHNADADRIWNRNTGNDRAGALYQQQVGELTGTARDIFNAANQAGNENARDATSVARANLETNARLGAADTRATATDFSAVQRADSTRYAADSRGNAARDVATTRANTPKVDSAGAAAAGRIYQQALQDGKSPADAAAAVQAWYQARIQSSTPNGQSGAPSAPAQQPGSNPAIPAEAIAKLRANPHWYSFFDQKYGNGAAAQYLKQQ